MDKPNQPMNQPPPRGVPSIYLYLHQTYRPDLQPQVAPVTRAAQAEPLEATPPARNAWAPAWVDNLAWLVFFAGMAACIWSLASQLLPSVGTWVQVQVASKALAYFITAAVEAVLGG